MKVIMIIVAILLLLSIIFLLINDLLLPLSQSTGIIEEIHHIPAHTEQNFAGKTVYWVDVPERWRLTITGPVGVAYYFTEYAPLDWEAVGSKVTIWLTTSRLTRKPNIVLVSKYS